MLTLCADTKNGNPDFGRFEEHQVELYDLEQDPTGEVDLAGQELERARRMRAQLVTWLGSAVDSGWSEAGPETQQTRDLLLQLGYTGGSANVNAADLIDPECDCEWCDRFGLEH